MRKDLPKLEEVQQKIFLTNKDIQVLCCCGESKATEIKKAVQASQDSYGGIFKTRISMADFQAWLKTNRRRKGVS